MVTSVEEFYENEKNEDGGLGRGAAEEGAATTGSTDMDVDAAGKGGAGGEKTTKKKKSKKRSGRKAGMTAWQPAAQ